MNAAAGTVAVVPTGGPSATGDWDGFAAELDPSAAPVPPPAPPDGNARVGQAPPGLADPCADGPPAPLMSYADVPPDSVSRKTKLQQGPPPDCHPTGWTVPDGGWEDTGGPLIHLRFGKSNPQQVFGAGWGLDWLLPPGGWAVEQLLMQDLRWEHLVAAALSPMGTGKLDGYVPTVAVPNWAQMIDRLIGAGFSKCYLVSGKESHLGAWTMDCVWNALQVWHGEVKSSAKGCWVVNALYTAAALQMAADCGVQLSQWTAATGGTVKRAAVGNVIEAYATLLVKDRAWEELSSIMFYLARHDSDGPSRFVTGRPQAGVSGQGALPPL